MEFFEQTWSLGQKGTLSPSRFAQPAHFATSIKFLNLDDPEHSWAMAALFKRLDGDDIMM